ncbi:MAG: c-type cytochrome [Cyanobacteria bacterium]|nr:c-type cytochrome [Cyanobacteriota bacterium]
MIRQRRLALLPLLLALTACGPGRTAAPASSVVPPFLETPVAAHPASSADTLALGKRIYDVNCAHCHGEAGDGNGFGAPHLSPAPRDFTTVDFKFRTTASGHLPTDEDLYRVVSRGLNGTGMPPWQYLLTDAERWAVVDYVKTFQPRFAEEPAATPVTLPDAPAGTRDLKRGAAVYATLECAKCHGPDGRGIGQSSLTLVDGRGRHVNARDFTQPGTFRTGWTEREIVRTIYTGNNGVAMPAYDGIVSKAEEYDLAAYIMSLAGHGPGNQLRRSARGMDGLGEPARVIALREHAWKYEPSEIRIKAGEVVRIDLSTTDNGLGAGHGFAIDGYDQQVFINGAMVGSPQSVTFRINEPGRYKFYCSTQCSVSELHPHMKGTLIVE